MRRAQAGGGPGKATVTLERDRITPVVEAVPARVCPNCREQYVDERLTNQLLAHRRRDAPKHPAMAAEDRRGRLVRAKGVGDRFHERMYAPRCSRNACLLESSVRLRDCLPRIPKKPSTWFSQEAQVGV